MELVPGALAAGHDIDDLFLVLIHLVVDVLELVVEDLSEGAVYVVSVQWRRASFQSRKMIWGMNFVTDVSCNAATPAWVKPAVPELLLLPPLISGRIVVPCVVLENTS